MTDTHVTKDFLLDAVRREGASLRAAALPELLDHQVPSCPDWTVADLVGHVGTVYRYHAAHVRRGVTTAPGPEHDSPPAGEAVLEWWDESFHQLLAVLETVDPDLPAWNWSIQEPKARFWHRRMAHETAVHRWDAQLASGLTEPIETRLAVDGIAEALDTFLAAGHRAGPDDLHGVVSLRATDTHASWAVRVRGTGLSLLDTHTVFDDSPHAQTAVSGSASDLLLALWGRVPFSVLTLQGDPELVTALLVG